jgi:hypothetical protein
VVMDELGCAEALNPVLPARSFPPIFTWDWRVPDLFPQAALFSPPPAKRTDFQFERHGRNAICPQRGRPPDNRAIIRQAKAG